MNKKPFADIGAAVGHVQETMIVLECQDCEKEFNRAHPTDTTRCPKCGSGDVVQEGKQKKGGPPKMKPGALEKMRAEPHLRDAYKKISSLKKKVRKGAPDEQKVINALDDVLIALGNSLDYRVSEDDKPKGEGKEEVIEEAKDFYGNFGRDDGGKGEWGSIQVSLFPKKFHQGPQGVKKSSEADLKKLWKTIRKTLGFGDRSVVDVTIRERTEVSDD